MTERPKALIANRGSFTRESLQKLAGLGIAVVHIHDIEGVKSVSDVPLRDYFAARAPMPEYSMSLEENCKYRYQYADAMLTERAKEH